MADSRYRYPRARIQIFSKAPQPGRVKTRLIPLLGARGAAELAARLLRHAVASAAVSRLCPVQLWCEPDTDHALFRELQRAHGVELKRQRGADLGRRMAQALAEGLAEGGPVLLMGSDCPAITPACLEQALRCLEETPCVLVPAEDGGYVLVGQSRLNTAMFENIDWGSADVLRQTRARLRASGWPHRELAYLADVDRPADVAAALCLLDRNEQKD